MDNIVIPKAKDRLMELFQREQFPEDVRQTLAGAFNGDLSRMHLLFQAMVDTWPRLQKNIGEIKRQVRRAPWEIEAHLERGEEQASDQAKERADLVDAALEGMKPRPAYGDLNKNSLIEDIAQSYFFGHHVSEITWHLNQNNETWGPSYVRSLSARFYCYSYASGEEEERLMLNRRGDYTMTGLEDFPENKFLLAINKGHPGHAAVAAPLRALAQYWLAAVYGLKWMMNFSQMFGIPFRWATVAENGDMQQACDMLNQIGSAGYAVFQKGTDLKFEESSKGGQGSLPQETLIKLADTQCDTFILGQTLTTDVGDSGSQALGNVHNEVRLDVMQGIGDYVADVFNCQFIPSIVSLNYGDTEMLPKMSVSFAPSKDENKKAERDARLFLEMGLPVSEQYLYKRHEVPVPEEGAILFQPRPNGAQGDPATGSRLQTVPVPHETKGSAEEEIKSGEKVTARDGSKMKDFGKEFSSMGIPRNEMPQIANGNRSAFVSFLKKRGITSERAKVPAKSLLPTQKDFNRDKVDSSKAFKGGSRSILISSDNRVLDGHHQWLAAFENGSDVNALRFDAPIARLLSLAHQLPSSKVSAMSATPADRSTLEELTANTLEGLTGVSSEWLSGVRPVFDRLAALAESGEVTDSDFDEALTAAQSQLPELFDVLDTDSLEEAFMNAIGTGVIAGSVRRFEDRISS